MRARTEGENPLWLTVNIEARRVRKHVGIVIWGKRRWPYHHALEDGRSPDFRVASGYAREGEVAIAAKTKALFERVRNECRIADQLRQLLWVRVQQVEGTAGRAACCR